MSAAKTLEIPGQHNPYAGEDYKRLVEGFPLIPIDSSDLHQKAKDVFLYLLRYKKDSPDDSDRIAQINAYMGSLKIIIQDYESREYKFSKPHPSEILADLIDMHQLEQSDFEKEIGKQPHVSRILSKQRDLTAAQMRALGKRFNLDPAVFL